VQSTLRMKGARGARQRPLGGGGSCNLWYSRLCLGGDAQPLVLRPILRRVPRWYRLQAFADARRPSCLHVCCCSAARPPRCRSYPRDRAYQTHARRTRVRPRPQQHSLSLYPHFPPLLATYSGPCWQSLGRERRQWSPPRQQDQGGAEAGLPQPRARRRVT